MAIIILKKLMEPLQEKKGRRNVLGEEDLGKMQNY